jgi:ABC-type cobalamin/Fe3+-siderophores transport system ATPase subunit
MPEPEPSPRPEPANAENPTDLLTATDVSFAYGDVPVVRTVSLALRAGEVVALLGPNGSGKSTLIRLLLGQLPGTHPVNWYGRPLREWRPRELARRVAYLPQAPLVDPSITVAEVLRLGRAPYWGAFGLESARDERVVVEVATLLSLTTRRRCCWTSRARSSICVTKWKSRNCSAGWRRRPASACSWPATI